MSKAPQVTSNTPKEPPSDGGKALVYLGAAAGAAVAGFVIYKILTKKEKRLAPIETPTREPVQIVTPTNEPVSVQQPTVRTTVSAPPTQQTVTYSERSSITDYATWVTWSEPKLGFKFKHPASYKIETTNGPSGEIVLVINLPIMSKFCSLFFYHR
jgi:hypothetical protein